MFFGEYEHTMDDKGRVTLPARFRETFAGGVVLARGVDRNVDVFPRAQWEESTEALAQLDPLRPEARRMRRHLFGTAAMDAQDRQGRVLVPLSLREYAGLGKDIAVVGAYDRLEIWDRRAWRAHLTEVEGSVEHVAERLANERS